MDAYFVMKPFEYISSLSAPNFRSNDKPTKMPKKSMYILIIVVPFSKSTVVVVLGLTGFEL